MRTDSASSGVDEDADEAYGVVAVQRSITLHERRLFFEHWASAASMTAASMTVEELAAAAAEANLDTRGVKSEGELRRFLEVAAQNERARVEVTWYWCVGRHAHSEPPSLPNPPEPS